MSQQVHAVSVEGLRVLSGTVAAAFTPLRNDGQTVDDDVISAYVEFLAAGGIDGILAVGSAGEGMLLTAEERRFVAECYRKATAGKLALAVHAGAMTTAETAAHAEHAAAIGADAVVAIAPPFYAYDDDALVEHFAAAAAACFPVPFYVYEYAERIGYAIDVSVIERLRECAPNLRGIKVTDFPFSAVEPYLALDGIDVFIGMDWLIPEGLAKGARGAASGLAAIDPSFVSDLVRSPSPDKAKAARERIAVYGPHLITRGKAELAKRGLMRADVRRPLLPFSL
ncbi:MAG: dihydrodipicolinate synthase family protein [Gaiellaceae bacterium]|jgi:dihydrodipicolinate synthase/N-acetylneuraminate lyase